MRSGIGTQQIDGIRDTSSSQDFGDSSVSPAQEQSSTCTLSSNEVPGEQASTVSDESSVSPTQEQSSTHTLSSNEVLGE